MVIYFCLQVPLHTSAFTSCECKELLCFECRISSEKRTSWIFHSQSHCFSQTSEIVLTCSRKLECLLLRQAVPCHVTLIHGQSAHTRAHSNSTWVLRQLLGPCRQSKFRAFATMKPTCLTHPHVGNAATPPDIHTQTHLYICMLACKHEAQLS